MTKPPEAIVSSRGLRALFCNERPGDPSGSQTEEQIATYYRNAKAGDVACHSGDLCQASLVHRHGDR
jgi:hypothetical protein